MQQEKVESPTAVSPSDILTPQELCKRLKVPETWVFEKTRRRASNKNPIPALRIGRYLRFDWGEVSVWLRSTSTDTHPAKRG